MNAPINKSWVSLCLPIHKEFEYLCLVSVLKLVFELHPMYDVAVKKEFANDICSVNTPLLSTQKYTWNLNLPMLGCKKLKLALTI